MRAAPLGPPQGQQARHRVLGRLRARLERDHYPRLALCAVLALGGLAGFLTSAGLLAAGLRAMAWRYGLAAVVGYGAFLGGLRLWLALHGRRRPGLEDTVDASDLLSGPRAGPGAASEADAESRVGGGGGFTGGGADVADAATALDEGATVVIPVVVVACIVVGLVGVVTVVIGAPALLAELLLDGVIAGAAYRRLRRVPVRHWLHGAVRRTWKPMLALGASLVLAGLVAQWLTPTADSIGDFLRP